MLLFIGEYDHAKNQGHLCIPSWDIDNQRFTCRAEFSQTKGLRRDKVNCKVHFRLLPAKNKIWSKLLKFSFYAYSEPFLFIFLETRVFLKNPLLSFVVISIIMQNFRKNLNLLSNIKTRWQANTRTHGHGRVHETFHDGGPEDAE